MDFLVPELGEGVYEAELVEWRVEPGDQVRRGDALAEVVTDKATMELPSPFAGSISKLKAEPGEPIKVGQVVLEYEPIVAGQPESSPADNPTETETSPATADKPNGPARSAASTALQTHDPSKRATAAPVVRRMARELGLDLAGISGSGPDGRVMLGDLAAYFQQTAPPPVNTAAPAFDLGQPGTRIKLRGVRAKIAERMVASKQIAPHYSYVDECEVTQLVRLRDSLKSNFRETGTKLTYLAFVVRAVVESLQQVPLVNASLDHEAGEIVLHDRYHIGIAVAAGNGLLVPVVRDADKLTLQQTAHEIERLSTAARAGRIRPDELRGSTFTVTSIGSIGGLISTPILNQPEVGILGLGKVVRRPVYDEGDKLRPADLMYLSFSFDHRVLDGAIGALFSNAVIDRLENPAQLLL